MKRSKLFVCLALTILLFTTLFYVLKKPVAKKEYIFNSHSNISLDDVARTSTALSKSSLDFSEQVVSDFDTTSEMVIDHNTLRFFKSLEQLFPESKDVNEHLEAIKNHLLSLYPPSIANALFTTYQSYLTCELELASKVDIRELNSYNTEEVIETLTKIHNLRREKLGQDIADSLFGAKVKAAEYNIRKAAILSNNDLYGADKENALEELNNNMWGDEADNVNRNSSAFNMYQEKLKIYKKDIEELDSEEESQAYIKQFREEFFSTETIEKLETAEKKRKEEDTKEADYFSKESEIMNSSEFNDEEKAEMVKDLQNELFGDGAENFRARLKLKIK